jgi:hypothetical protein
MRKSAFVLVALVLAGCGLFGDGDGGTGPDLTVDMTEQLVAGSWRNDDRGATLTFDDNGTFEGTNVPPEFFQDFTMALAPGFTAGRDRIDASGRWTLPDKNPSYPDRHRNVLRLVFEPGGFIQSRTGGEMEAWYAGSRETLVIKRVVFLKCADACAAVGTAKPSPSR